MDGSRLLIECDENFLREKAQQVRLDVLEMTSLGASSHIGSCFSVVDILTVLYSGILKVRPEDPNWSERDYFILSKGHAGAALYATLAAYGFFSRDKLKTHYQDGSDLSGHVSHLGIPGVEFSTGSLGHGLPVGVGIAKAFALDGSARRVFVQQSDGECDEGSVWEAVLFAAHHHLDNLVLIIDYNKIQSLAPVSETIGLEPIADKFESFGWGVVEVNGHDYGALLRCFHGLPANDGKPTCVIAHTVKGKGVSFMEHSVLWHYRSAQGDEYNAARSELMGVS
ncbi:MAG: transketolase [Bdellovibrionales bacterium]|nr:transketolase [Bdellovibrionales bacterium]